MNYLEQYLMRINKEKDSSLAESINQTVQDVVPQYIL